MEIILASVVLSLSTNVDNFAVGVAYSIKRLTINFAGNFVIALLSGISTFASMSIGDWINQRLPAHISHQLGSGVLILMGVLTIVEILKRKFTSPPSTQLPLDLSGKRKNYGYSGRISLQEALILGVALTITNLGTGIGAGIAQLNVLLTSICSFLSSFLMVGGGTFLGNRLNKSFSERPLELFAGIILVLLGVYESVFP